MLNRYEYLYDKDKGYYLEPKNINIIEILPKTKSVGLVKVCKRKDFIYIFIVKDKTDKEDRDFDNPIIIYEIDDLKEISKIEGLQEIKEKLENKELSLEERKNVLCCLKEKSYLFKKDIVPFFILSEFDMDKVCFEKNDILNFRLDTIQNCILNNFEEIKNYYEFLKTKDLKKVFKCLNEEKLIELLDECRRDVYLNAKKYGLNLQRVVLDKSCYELKKDLLKFIIDKGEKKDINKLYKSLNYKFFIGI